MKMELCYSHGEWKRTERESKAQGSFISDFKRDGMVNERSPVSLSIFFEGYKPLTKHRLT